MAKLPGITQQSVAEFQKGYIPQPNYAAEGRAIQGMFLATAQAAQTIQNVNAIKEVDEATGTAANELSELRATLEHRPTIPASEVPPDILTPLEMSITTGLDGRKEISRPFVYTHDIANELWAKRSSEIVHHHAQSIRNPQARAKFVTEMTQRYLAPGTAAIIRSSVLRSQAQGQAQAETAIQEIASSSAPPEEREVAMREVIARRLLMGADPVWGENQLQAVGPMIDQFDIQNEIIQSTNIDELDQIEERMYEGGTRLSPEQMRTMGSQIRQRKVAMRQAEDERQQENGEQMLVAYNDPNIPFGLGDVNAALAAGDINWSQAWTFRNALQSGSTTRATDPFVLSRYRGAITMMQYTGNQNRVTDRANLLRAAISRATMGLNPDGSPNPLGATISGEDAFKLGKDIDTALNSALENNDYDNALKDLLAWTRVNVNLEGQIIAQLGGNQGTVEAAIAFKQALDNYMDQFGADADPTEFVNDNKDAYNPNNFEAGINARFREQIPQASNFMRELQGGIGEWEFTRDQQDQFVLWLNSNQQALGIAEYNRIYTLFQQYYRGQGVAPNGGALQLEGDDPLYRQFEAFMMPDVGQ